MSTIERKRTYSNAFSRPATPKSHQIKAARASISSSPCQHEYVKDENEPPGDYIIADDVTASRLRARRDPLQELVEISASGGLFRHKLVLGAYALIEVEPQLGTAPFEIWEDVDVAAERLDLGSEAE